MCDLKTVGIEVWPVAADTEAIWLAGRDAWRDGPLPAATTVHYEVQRLLFEHDIDPDDLAVFIQLPEAAPQAGVIHSTSWRDAGPAVVLTYMAVVRVEGYVIGSWPDAAPVMTALTGAIGKPRPHRAAQAPECIRPPDVLLHGLRHLKFQLGPWGDANIAAAMDRNWRRHLHALKPALATMYSERLAG
jgi:hypothetical protein